MLTVHRETSCGGLCIGLGRRHCFSNFADKCLTVVYAAWPGGPTSTGVPAGGSLGLLRAREGLQGSEKHFLNFSQYHFRTVRTKNTKGKKKKLPFYSLLSRWKWFMKWSFLPTQCTEQIQTVLWNNYSTMLFSVIFSSDLAKKAH